MYEEALLVCYHFCRLWSIHLSKYNGNCCSVRLRVVGYECTLSDSGVGPTLRGTDQGFQCSAAQRPLTSRPV